MAYERSTYTLRRFEIVAPSVLNDGTPSPYASSLRSLLAAAGFSGWTETDTRGYWLGKVEPGVTFTIFATDEWDVNPLAIGIPGGRPDCRAGVVRHATVDVLAHLARAIMVDQEAIQVVRGEEIELREA